ncbi:MBL fold metallo-hydrolase [Actinoplanes sp. N902-109]|uniref:MBL fold metallo-hydrolase n=1 Tax=Actinoplanes sp. (strain N902-109) TaxID=649831 RepID=UPI0003295C1D|nr:MBL fold metallo-hydrolase [Actinoplanes sp. N902-109]AGL15478.1 beta-lactamase domain-containing protein [Actinoplanes sp. N902-109]
MQVIELLPRLYMFDFPIGHAYLWESSDGLTLIDTSLPGSAPYIAEAIEGLGHRRSDLRRLLLTHFHQDHVGSATDIAAWSDTVVYAHQADAPVIRGEAPGPAPELADWERSLFDQVQSRIPSDRPAPVRVDQELEDGDLVDLGGGGQAVTLAVPGHTPGSVAFYLPEPRVLFTGDTIARGPDGKVILGVFNVEPRQAVTSFKRQSQLDIEIACFGHGQPLTENTSAQLRKAASLLPG